MKPAIRIGIWLALALAAPSNAYAQSAHKHESHSQRSPTTDRKSVGTGPTEPGQGAFAAIAEIVRILRADPATDWSSIDIEALRRHLIDMDNVTMRAQVAAEKVDGGARFLVTSATADVVASIRRMVLAHAATMNGVDGLRMKAEEIGSGASLEVTGPHPDMIRSLGFIGLMTVGMHHQAHHLAVARGGKPHAH